MLYESILLGCQKYHQATDSYDDAYGRYRNDRDEDKWSNPETLDHSEINRLVLFVNQWSSHMPRDTDNVERVLGELKRQIPRLSRLNEHTLLDVELDETTCELIEGTFDAVANTGRRFESVATSKMLHAAVNPELFVMWDGRIMSGYGLYGSGGEYAQHFLPKMQSLARESMSQVNEESPVRSYPPPGHTLAKVIDEYNYVKFTLGDKELQKKEDRP